MAEAEWQLRRLTQVSLALLADVLCLRFILIHRPFCFMLERSQ